MRKVIKWVAAAVLVVGVGWGTAGTAEAAGHAAPAGLTWTK